MKRGDKAWIAWNRRQGRFGNRCHGRFPRVGVDAQGPNLFQIIYTLNRYEYEHGGNALILVSRRDLRILRDAATAALHWKDPLRKKLRRRHARP